jgi:hypothetical protein
LRVLKDTSAYQHSIVERRAYEICLVRIEKAQPGSALEDWLKAEQAIGVEAVLAEAFG